MQLRHHVGRLRHRGNHVVGEGGRVRACESNAFEPLDSAGCTKQLAERELVTELNPVGVDVLTEKRDFDCAVSDECFNFGKHVTRASVTFFAAQARHDAERARVVATDRDGYPTAVRRVALRGQCRRERFERLEDLNLGLRVVATALEQARQGAHVVSSEDDINVGRARDNGGLVFLGEASANGNLHAFSVALDAGEMTQGSVELV